MSRLPAGWAWKTLGEIAEVVGGVTKDAKREGRPDLVEVPYLRVANVQRGRIDLSNIASIRVSVATVEKLRLQAGDVLLNEGGDRDKLGRGWVWQGQVEGCIHQNHVFRARIRDAGLHPKLLAWYANEVAHKWFEANGKQSVNLASISLSKIKTFPIPVPPVPEQRRIVDILEDHLSRLDAAHRELLSCTAGLRALHKSVLAALIPEMAHYPTEWIKATVADAGEVELGRQRHPDWHSGPNMRPYLRVANVFEDRLDLTDVKEMHWPGDSFARFRLMPGDVLLNEGQSPELVGRPAIYRGKPQEIAFTNSLIRFQAHTNVLPEFALLVFRRHLHVGRFAKEARITTNIAHLSASRLRLVEFPIPPLATQATLVAEARQRMEDAARLDCGIRAAQERADALRRALLEAAFAGRLTDVDHVEEMTGV